MQTDHETAVVIANSARAASNHDGSSISGTLQRDNLADLILKISVVGTHIQVDILKSRDRVDGVTLATDDPRMNDLRSAVLRFMDGDVA